MKAVDLSKYVIGKFDNVGDLISNKKLQKLLYYIEAWSLVYTESIIDDDFEAWIHGPVIPVVYHEYKSFGYSPIQIDYSVDKDSSKLLKNFKNASNLEERHFDLIDAVIEKYGVLTSHELEMLSHSEKPWIETRKELSPFDHCSNVIDKALMKEFYSSYASK